MDWLKNLSGVNMDGLALVLPKIQEMLPEIKKITDGVSTKMGDAAKEATQALERISTTVVSVGERFTTSFESRMDTYTATQVHAAKLEAAGRIVANMHITDVDKAIEITNKVYAAIGPGAVPKKK